MSRTSPVKLPARRSVLTASSSILAFPGIDSHARRHLNGISVNLNPEGTANVRRYQRTAGNGHASKAALIMFVIDTTALARDIARRYLAGEPTDSIADRVAASKIIDFRAARARREEARKSDVD